MEDNILDRLTALNKKWTLRDAKMLSPLQLAYIGDSVYEVLVRTYLINTKDISVHELHKEAIKFVKAKAQADIVFSLEDKLTEEEKTIVKRGRNAKSGTIPKNASLHDYKYATGFEALIGFLYLLERNDRIMELFKYIIEE
ncbi:mini-ribonuclease 3 [Gottschalkia purinilytica]|uniref:Mini-ribonuclease 3 n=1 Tax=Gottschalkia purinilytica TaxID=1503 RepID=A0A0L0W8Y3_GOTPU|nr:ribonuclease III domain-containing protein [Gottschalkia purinilytica]KNF07998.1 mini-ribonuclease 3 [Gottschalkia purinilytica]